MFTTREREVHRVRAAWMIAQTRAQQLAAALETLCDKTIDDETALHVAKTIENAPIGMP